MRAYSQLPGSGDCTFIKIYTNEHDHYSGHAKTLRSASLAKARVQYYIVALPGWVEMESQMTATAPKLNQYNGLGERSIDMWNLNEMNE